MGITVGFHRLATHRSFQTYPAVRYALAEVGTLAVEGSVIKWVADHRKHHVFTDNEPAGPPRLTWRSWTQEADVQRRRARRLSG